MKSILFAALLSLSFGSFAQDTTKVKAPTYKVLTGSEAVYDLLVQAFKADLIRATVSAKNHRTLGRYIEYTIILPATRKAAAEAFMLRTWGEGTNKAKNK